MALANSDGKIPTYRDCDFAFNVFISPHKSVDYEQEYEICRNG